MTAALNLFVWTLSSYSHRAANTIVSCTFETSSGAAIVVEKPVHIIHALGPSHIILYAAARNQILCSIIPIHFSQFLSTIERRCGMV